MNRRHSNNVIHYDVPTYRGGGGRGGWRVNPTWGEARWGGVTNCSNTRSREINTFTSLHSLLSLKVQKLIYC